MELTLSWGNILNRVMRKTGMGQSLTKDWVSQKPLCEEIVLLRGIQELSVQRSGETTGAQTLRLEQLGIF